MTERDRRAPRRKLVKMHPFWIEPEQRERLRSAQETVGAAVGVRQSLAEMLRTVISLGLDAFERKMARGRP